MNQPVEIAPSRSVIKALHNRQLGHNKQAEHSQYHKKYAREVKQQLKGYVKASQSIPNIDDRLIRVNRQISNARANREATYSYQGLVHTRDVLHSKKDKLKGYYNYI